MNQHVHASGRLLAETAAYRITHYPRGDGPLMVTFNHMGLGLDGQFGTRFLAREGVSQIHVACAWGSHYQGLSRDAFRQAVDPLLARAPRVLTYGCSLGAYAAIYYAWEREAEVLALAPRLPPHPYMRDHPAHVPDLPLHHDDLRGLGPPRARITTVHDPTIPPEEAFLTLFLRPHARQAHLREVALPDSGHHIAHELSLQKALVPAVRAFIERGDFETGALDPAAFTQARRHRAHAALSAGAPAEALPLIRALATEAQGAPHQWAPFGLIRRYIRQTGSIGMEIPRLSAGDIPLPQKTLTEAEGAEALLLAQIALFDEMCQFATVRDLAVLAARLYPANPAFPRARDAAQQLLDSQAVQNP